jgi:23S rRNA (adenine2503-C2)-methyltransferase
MKAISIHDASAIEALFREYRLDPESLRRVRIAFFKKHLSADRVCELLPPDVRDTLAGQIAFQSLELAERHDSRLDGATKLVFNTHDNRGIESVILRMTSGRTALCLSTQVGCRAHCRFCATGQMDEVRNLSVAEILDQVVQASALIQVEGRGVRNLVFMGMGEPFHNEAALQGAIRALVDPRAFNFHPRRLLISTVGIPDGMVRASASLPDVRLAVSLHSAKQEVRERLMPIARRHPLAELRSALEQVASTTTHKIMIEYLLLADLNDSLADADALVDYLAGISVHVNLIPYNAIAGASDLRASDPARRTAFSRHLKEAGLSVTTRYSLGADITAACGQLVRKRAQVAVTEVAPK